MNLPSTTVSRGRPAAGFALALTLLLASLGTSILNVALPALVTAFSVPFAQIQGVVVAYLLGLTGTVVIAGRLGDRFGMRRMLTAGLTLFGAASLLCGLAGDLPLLLFARLLQGSGAAFMMTLPMAMMREQSGSDRLGRAMGLLGTVSALGTALGPSLGGVLLSSGGWRGIFWLLLPLTALALLLVRLALPVESGRSRPAAVGMRAGMHRKMIPTLGVNLLVSAVMMTTLIVGPFYLTGALGMQDTETGLIMAVGPVVSILSGIPAGRLVDALGARRMMLAGLMLLATGSLLLAASGGSGGLAGYLFPLTLLTPGYQLWQAANNSATLADAAGDRRGTLAGLLGLSRNLGMIAGASGMGALFAFSVGATDLAAADPSSIATGMRLTFLVAGLILLVAIGITRAATRPPRL